MNTEEIDHLNRLITRNEIEFVIKILPTKKVQDQMASQANSTKHTELLPILLKLFQKVEEEGIIFTFFLCSPLLLHLRCFWDYFSPSDFSRVSAKNQRQGLLKVEKRKFSKSTK